jgi:hypothetical protein
VQTLFRLVRIGVAFAAKLFKVSVLLVTLGLLGVFLFAGVICLLLGEFLSLLWVVPCFALAIKPFTRDSERLGPLTFVCVLVGASSLVGIVVGVLLSDVSLGLAWTGSLFAMGMYRVKVHVYKRESSGYFYVHFPLAVVPVARTLWATIAGVKPDGLVVAGVMLGLLILNWWADACGVADAKTRAGTERTGGTHWLIFLAWVNRTQFSSERPLV